MQARHTHSVSVDEKNVLSPFLRQHECSAQRVKRVPAINPRKKKKKLKWNYYSFIWELMLAFGWSRVDGLPRSFMNDIRWALSEKLHTPQKAASPPTRKNRCRLGIKAASEWVREQNQLSVEKFPEWELPLIVLNLKSTLNHVLIENPRHILSVFFVDERVEATACRSGDKKRAANRASNYP